MTMYEIVFDRYAVFYFLLLITWFCDGIFNTNIVIYNFIVFGTSALFSVIVNYVDNLDDVENVDALILL